MNFGIKEVDEKELMNDLVKAQELLTTFHKPYKKFFNKVLTENAQVRAYVCDALIQSVSKDGNIPQSTLISIIEKIKADLFKEEKEITKPIKKYIL